jgi:acyl-CoA hydrolase
VTHSSPQVIIMIEMVFPDQTNHYDALRLMDKAVFIAPSRCSRRTVVTACSERIDFRNAAQYGNLIELNASVLATG